MIARFIARILGTANERTLNRLRPMIEKINSLEPRMSAMTDDELAAQTNEFREQISKGRSLDDILFEAFAVVREVSKRRIGQRHFDVQLMGGIVLHQGKISEMKTGEGKTLTATLPLYLNALSGKGAHLVTVNDYLARRDAEWMSPIYQSLGLEVATIQHSMTDHERKRAYQADILYVTNNELGFDYLRDNMKFRLEDYVQRELHYAIVDEVDSILIDEARTPLIISGAAEESGAMYAEANRVVARLKVKEDYEVDEKQRSVLLTEAGIDKIEEACKVSNLYASENLTLLHHINQALRAHMLFKRDVDYVVDDGQVMIVDEFTGRILSGRRYSDGLHQAIEAKEGVKIERENQTLASITLQNLFRLYGKLGGMTGTAATEAEEFHNIYKLDVVSIPTNRSMIRIDQPDLIFLSKNAKFEAIVDDVKERHKKGQPVLIGTIAIETSELLSNFLRVRGIPHEVLNAKQHQREAEIIEHAGEVSRVTIATNMAGRGTDIKLSDEARAAGGLYILGTERHESRRIDNQLRGRSGRQGDPGESRFYISLEDDLIRIFAGDSLKSYMERFGMKEDETIESRFVSRTIERAQEKVEKHNFDIRRHLIEYDDVLNQQRIVVYRYRRDALEGEERIYGLIRDFIARIVEEVVGRFCQRRLVEVSEAEAVFQRLHTITGIEVTKLKNSGSNRTIVAQIASDLTEFLLEHYDLFRNQTENKDMLRQVEKWMVLEVIDQAWKQHMLNIDYLKEGINLRSWGQKNPLVEYKREAFEMFEEMMAGICHEVVRGIFHLNVDHFNHHVIEARRERELETVNMNAQEEGGRQTAPVRTSESRAGRNDPCPCGSGKKYKKCHGA